MSTTTKQVLIIVKQQGLDQATTAIKGLDTTSKAATKSTNGLGSAFDKGQGNALKLRTGVTNLDKSENKAVGTTNKFAQSTDKAAKSTSGLAAKFQGNKGLIFSTVGIATAGLEAVGMFQQYQNATAKVSEAQERLNQLERAGLQDTKAYTDATRDLTDANRGAQFALRILTLSVGDLIPFTLLLINSAFKLKETIGGAKTAVDATAQATTALGNASRGAATGGMAQIATSASTATTGFNNMGNASKLTNTAIGGLTTTATNFDRGLTTVNTRVQDATRLIGTTSTAGLLGGITGLNTGMDDGTKKSSKFRDAFTQIGNSIKNLPNLFKNIATSIGGFFTNFGTHIGKLPGLFKTAGAAVAGFGKALLGLALNPIGLAIIGVSTAVLALATDFGGVRTAINNAGVAIGNAIPQLKGILTWIGNAANGALDAVASFLGFETSAKKSGAAAAAAALEMDPLIIALQKYIDLGPQFNNLNNIVAVFANVRTEVTKVADQFDVFRGKSVSNLQAVGNAFTTAVAVFQDKSPQAKVAIQHVYDTIKLLETGHYDAATSQKFLTTALDAAYNALGNQVKGTEKDVAAKQKQTEATKGVQDATLELKEGALAVASAMVQQATSGEKVKGTMDANTEAVKTLLNEYNIQIDAIEQLSEADLTLLQSLYSLGPALEVVGAQLQINDDNSINWAKTMDLLIAKQYDIGQQADEIWGLMGQLIEQEGVEGYKKVILFVDMFKAKDAELGAALEQRLNDEMALREQNTTTISTMIDTALEGGEEVVNIEQEQQEALKKTQEEIAKKATELGIFNQIQGLSIQSQQNAIKVTEEQNKGMEQSRAKIQQMALARGLNVRALDQENGALLKFIQANNTSTISVQEVTTALEDMITARLEDARQSKVQEQANLKLLTAMGKVPPVVGMTSKGLAELVTVYDDTANASGVAADDIGTWYAELERSQAVEDASIQKLLELADTLGVEIPDSAEMTVEGLKKIIEGSIDMGEQAKKSADEAASAFGKLANDAAGALEDLIKEDLIKGDIDDVIEKLEEAGTSVDTLAGKQAIIKPILDATAIDDGLLSLTEMLDDTWAQATLQAKDGGDSVVQQFQNGLMSHLGELGPPIVSHVGAIWQQLKATNPGKTGAELIQMLSDELGNPGPITAAAMKAGGAIQPGIQQGASGLPGTVQQIVNGGLSPLEQSVAKFFNGGKDLGAAVPEGTEQGAAPLSKILEPPISDLESLLSASSTKFNSQGQALGAAIPEGAEQGAAPLATTLEDVLAAGSSAITAQGPAYHSGGMTIGNEAVSGVGGAIQGGAQVIQNATLAGFNTPIMGAIGQIPTLAGTALAPLEGTTQGEFVKAQMAANSVISVLLADLDVSFGFLVQNVQQKLTQVSQAWITHSSNVQQVSGQIATTIATITTAVTNFAGTAVKSLAGITATTTSTGNAFKTMGTSVSSGSSVGLSGVTNFTGVAGKGLGGIIAQAGATGKAFQSMGSQISSAMSSAASRVSSFGSSASSAFSKVKSQADAATKSVKALQSAVNALKSKSITIHVGISGPGAAYLRTGGAFISPEPTGFAQTGKSFVNSKPRRIGGVNISEFGKPELVTVTPLSNPFDPTDKNLSMNIPNPKAQPIPQVSSGLTGGGIGGGLGAGQPIQVTGDTHVTIMTPDGTVLAKLVQPHLLKGFSGIT